MRTTSGIFQFAVIILTLQAIFYCHGVNASDDGNNEGNPDDTTSGFLNPQWSELWGGIVQSHDVPRSNLKISRNKRKAWNSGSGDLDRARNYKFRDGNSRRRGNDGLSMSAF